MVDLQSLVDELIQQEKTTTALAIAREQAPQFKSSGYMLLASLYYRLSQTIPGEKQSFLVQCLSSVNTAVMLLPQTDAAILQASRHEITIEKLQRFAELVSPQIELTEEVDNQIKSNAATTLARF